MIHVGDIIRLLKFVYFFTSSCSGSMHLAVLEVITWELRGFFF